MNIEEIFLWGILSLNCILIIIGFVICAFIVFVATTYSTAILWMEFKEYSEMFDE